MPPAAQPPLALVVTADDFGIGVETSRGILQAHRDGPVTATSLMVITGRHAEQSVPLLSEATNLDVGLHLVLTRCGHRPLTAGKSSGLVDRDGNFHTNSRLWIQSWLRKLNIPAVAEEIAAQAELFVRLVGRKPDYVDGHHHAHQLPAIRQALLEVISNTKLLPAITRTTIEPPGMLKAVASARTRPRAANILGKRAAPLFAAANVWTNDFYFGMIDSAVDPFPWSHYLRHLPSHGVIEWVVHPGLNDPTLEGRDDYRAERPAELAALTNPNHWLVWQPFKPYLSRKSKLDRFSASSSAF